VTVAIYLQGFVVASHDLSRHLFGRNVNRVRDPRVGPEEVRAAMRRVDAMYDRVDRIVGELVDSTSDTTDVIVVSDHGWEYDGTAHLNHNPGTFIAAGPSFKSGERTEALSVLDVLPLLLSILELPLSERLEGRVPSELLAPGLPTDLPVVERYEMRPVSLAEGVRSRAPDDRRMLERLRGLGYLDDGADPPGPPAGS
jgi:arylsulfatase A-like enzyme